MDKIKKRNIAMAEKLGELALCDCLIEEMSELTKALLKYRRARGIGQPTNISVEEAKNNLIEEFVDVEIASFMYKYITDISDEQINEWLEKKTKRNIDRLGIEDID